MKTKTVKQLTEEKTLQQKIHEDKIDREEGFRVYLQEGLKKFNVELEPRITVTAKGNLPSLNITAL